MLSAFTTTLSQMLHVLLLMAVGFTLNKLKILPESTRTVFSKVSTNLFLPCLLLYTYSMECDLSNLITYSRWTLYGIGYSAVNIALAYLLAGRFTKDPYERGIFRYAISMPNTNGIMVPLILGMFGRTGLFQMQMFQFVPNIATYTWGILNLQPGEKKHSFGYYIKQLLNPVLIAIILGMVLGLLGAKTWMPAPVATTIEEFGKSFTVVGLMLVGFSVADFPLKESLATVKVSVFSLLRLLLIPSLMLLIVWLLKLPPMLCMLAVVAVACPCGMNTVVYPAAYGKNCKTGAGMVLETSFLAIFTVPVMYTLCVSLCGQPI